MKTRKILIFDDESKFAERWKSRLEKTLDGSGFKTDVLGMDNFNQVVEALELRRRKDKKADSTWNNQLDQADIFIIDFQLLKLNRITYITGESLAYLARCYSRCGLIVTLNQYVDTDFDLTLKGHPDSYADLNVNDKYVDNPGLWQESWNGTRFRPWAWPLLPKALDAFEKRVTELLEPASGTKLKLDEPILSFFGLDQVAGVLPRSTLEFIQTRKGKISEVTFKDFVSSSRQGLHPKDLVVDDESIARIAAARIHKWLERLVLPGQDIIIDTPHLISRFPSLLKGDLQKLPTWNKSTTLGLPAKVALRSDSIKPFLFNEEIWLSRPCWFWGGLSNYEKISEVRDPWANIEKANVVFCEDVSSFLPRKEATEFVADVSSPFVRRYVKKLPGISYQPSVRFAM